MPDIFNFYKNIQLKKERERLVKKYMGEEALKNMNKRELKEQRKEEEQKKKSLIALKNMTDEEYDVG
jgi:hypothetical protein